MASSGSGPFLGLDWFVLSLILYSAVFVPLERWFARLPEQPLFRETWPTDFSYFFVSAILVQVTTLLTLRPAMLLFDWARVATVHAWVQASPGVVQFGLMVLVSDFTQYWVHRAFHAVPVLWRFHAVHHSAEQMDWLAGSRLHLVDIAVTRGLTYVPIYVLGFSDGPLAAYSGLRERAGHVHPCQRALRVAMAAVDPRDAALPSLAPRRRARGGGHELRRPPARAGPAVRHGASARPLAVGIRPCAWRPGASRVPPAVALAAPARLTPQFTWVDVASSPNSRSLAPVSS